MKKLLIGFVLFFFLIIVLIVVWGVHSFNAESYRKQIIDSVSELTGRKVEIKGGVSLSWTPFPVLVVSGLEVANQEKSDTPIMFTVEQIRSEIEWKSLFHRPLVIKKVEFKNPVLLLERIKGSQTNFDFLKLFNSNLSQEDNLFLDNKAELSLSMESVYISDGTFNYDNKLSGDKLTISQIDGVGKMDSLDGPFSLSGTAVVLNKKMDFSFDFNKIEPSQPKSFSVQMTEKDSETEFKFSGRFNQDSKNPENWLNVSVVSKSNKPHLFLKDYLSDWPAKPIVINCDLDIMARKIQMNNFTLRQIEENQNQDTSIYYGPQENNLDKPFVLDIKNMDYNQWKDFISTLLKKESFWGYLKKFHFQFENVKYDEALLPKAQGGIQIDGDTILLTDLFVDLPFNSSVAFNGKWNPKGKEGLLNIQVQSADFRSLLNWGWKMDLNEFPENVFKTFQLDGQWQLAPNKNVLTVKAAVLDGIQYAGLIDIGNSTEGRQIKLDGQLDGLNLNSYFPQKEVKQLIKRIDPKSNIIFNLKGSELTFDDLSMKTYAFDGQMANNMLALKNFSLETEDKVFLSGETQIKDILTNLQVESLQLNFEAPEQTAFYEKLKSLFFWPPISDIVKGKLSYTSLDKEGGKFNFTIQNGKLDFSSEGKIVSPFEKPHIEENICSIRYPEVQEFLSHFQDLKTIFPYLQGALDLKFSGKNIQDDFQMDHFSILVGKQALQGKGTVNLKDKRFNLDATTAMLNPENFIPSGMRSFRIDNFPEWRGSLNLQAENVMYNKKSLSTLKMQLILGDKKIDIPSLTFMLAGNMGSISSKGSIIFNESVEVLGKVKVDHFVLPKRGFDFSDLALSDGRVDITSDFSSTGDTFTSLKSNLKGKGIFTWKNGFIEGLDLAGTSSKVQSLLQENQSVDIISTTIKQSLLHSKTPVNHFTTDFQIQKGVVSVPEVTLETMAGKILINRLNWLLSSNALNVDLLINLTRFKDAPDIELLIQKNKATLKSAAFEKAIQTRIVKQKEEVKKQEEQKAIQEAKENQEKIQQSAQEILVQSERQIQELKNKYALHPSESAHEQLKKAEETAMGIRQLSVQSELSLSEYNALLEKAKILTLQSQEMDQTQLRQDVVNQKENIEKILEVVQNSLDEIGRIYRRNSTSTILATLLQKSQEESEKIRGWWGSMQKTQKIEEAAQLSEQINDLYKKIQKAWDYANQLEKGVVPSSSISGTISVIEE